MHPAARLCGAAAALRETIGVAPGRSLRDVEDQRIAALRDALGGTAYAAYAEGRAHSLEDGGALALERTTAEA